MHVVALSVYAVASVERTLERANALLARLGAESTATPSAFLPATTTPFSSSGAHGNALSSQRRIRNWRWDSYVVESEYAEANAHYDSVRLKHGIHADGIASVAERAVSSDPRDRTKMQSAGELADDGCPCGVGAFGFDQYPSLVTAVVVDGARVAVLHLHNRDWADRYHGDNEQSCATLLRGAGLPTSAKARLEAWRARADGYGLVSGPGGDISSSGLSTRHCFRGASTEFVCRFADGSEVSPLDNFPHDTTCSIALTVWCPLPDALRTALLESGKRRRIGPAVQLVALHRFDALPPQVYPPVPLCLRPPIVPLPTAAAAWRPTRPSAPVKEGQKVLERKHSRVALCAYFDPEWDTAAELKRWLLWHFGRGAGHAYVYYMAGSHPGLPAFDTTHGPRRAPGDQAQSATLLAELRAAGLVTVRNWNRWPDWWYDPEVATVWGSNDQVVRDYRLFGREGWPDSMQVPAYNDCRLRAYGRHDWVVPLDADEYLHAHDAAHPAALLPDIFDAIAAREERQRRALAAPSSSGAPVDGIRFCARFWHFAEEDAVSGEESPFTAAKRAPTMPTLANRWVPDDNRVAATEEFPKPMSASGCTCVRWWKTAYKIDAMRNRLGGHSMHDAEKSFSGPPHVNANACSEMSVAHHQQLVLRANVDARARRSGLGGLVTSGAFTSTEGCIDAAARHFTSLEHLRGCMATHTVPFGTTAREAQSLGQRRRATRTLRAH